MEKTTKILKKILILISSFTFFLTSCTNELQENFNSNQQKFGSLVVEQSRSYNFDDMKVAKIEVTGSGIDKALTSESTISSGAGTFSVDNIPVGKNRIVTVYAFDSSSVKLGSILVRAVCDIQEGKNSVSVNNSTTAFANVFNELLLLNYDISSINDNQKTNIQSAIDSSKNWSLIDSKKIAADFKNSSLKSSENYVLAVGSVSFTNNAEKVSVQVADPVSNVLVDFFGTDGKIENVAPGNWPVYVTLDGKITRTFVNIAPGTNSDLGELGTKPITDRIILHVYDYTHIWAWNKNPDENYTASGEWPGDAMTQEGTTDWYNYTINKTSSMVIFSYNGSNQNSKDGKLIKAGEYWFKNGEWYDTNPDDSVAPILLSFDSSVTGTVTGKITLQVSAGDNFELSYAMITVDGSALTKLILTGTSDAQSYVWDTSLTKNDKHTLSCVIFDKAGNSSEVKTIELVTKNENLAPVSVISGSKTVVKGSQKTYSAAKSYDLNGTVASYKWTVSGFATIVGSSTEETVSVKFADSLGSATLSLVVTDNEGKTSDSVSYDVEIKEQSNFSTDFRDETIYFLMTTRFYDGDSSNNRYCWDDEVSFKSETLGDPGWRGDFKGLIEKLDYIKALGFSAIWITPVVENASGLDYHGYHAFDFSKVDPRYESAGATYQDLIDACHAKGIKVIQDIVLNHTGNFGERNLLPIMKKNYSEDDGVHSVPAVPDHDSTDIYGNSAYEKLSLGAKTQGYNTYEEVEASPDDGKRGERLYQSRLMTMKNDSIDKPEQGELYHHYGQFQWESYYVQEGQMAGDCVDLNTENPVVAKYLRDCYINYINMGVDAFRIDTMKHISRLTMNKEFIPYFLEAGGEDFFMFGEGCVLRNEVWNANMPGISVPFYTWKENSSKTDASYDWKSISTGAAANLAMAKTHFDDNSIGVQLESNNAFLNGNDYHTPDYSKASGLQMIDFYMHHGFENAGAAKNIALGEDKYFNDATYNVTYVDSHDYGPNSGGFLYTRYSGGTQGWASNFNLMFTFRGIPCVYYGSEIEFQKGMQIEPYTNGNKVPYQKSGRAYFGDNIEGTVNATDFGEFTASGKVEETLNYELSKHLIRLNKIRRSISALRKGQYSVEGCNGGVSYKRRYTDENVDSFALVTLDGQATFTGIPTGDYIEVITGKTVHSNGTLTSDSISAGNMRIYVLKTATCEVNGKIGVDGAYLK